MKIPLQYKDRRSEGETTLRQCQLVQLHLLHVFDKVCKQNNIPYFLIGGTLLGAMRHDGFIPWDDDLDVGVGACDYSRMVACLRKDLPADVVLQTPKDVPHAALPFCKIRDANSFYCETRRDLSMADPSGIYVDIFLLEKFPKLNKSFVGLLRKICGSTWQRSKYYHNKARDGFILPFIYIFVADVCSLCHGCVRGLLCVLRHVFGTGCLGLVTEAGFYHLHDARHFEKAVLHKFEDDCFPIPKNADAVLQEQYGDWHWIPPPEKRPRHARIIDPFHSALG